MNGGCIKIGGADVRDIPKAELMDNVSFVFQNSELIKASILDNVKMGKPDATEAEVMQALKAAQCTDIIEKLPDGVNTVIGTGGVYLSGGEQQRIATAAAATVIGQWCAMIVAFVFNVKICKPRPDNLR